MLCPRSALLITLGVSFSTVLATEPSALARLHDTFSPLDQHIAIENAPWQTTYRQALDLARSDSPQRALPVLETLLDTLAGQPQPFSRVYVRYTALAEHLGQHVRVAHFLQNRSGRLDLPLIQGELYKSRALAAGVSLIKAFTQRMQAQEDQNALAKDFLLIYLLIWPFGIEGEDELKRCTADEIANAMGSGFNRAGLDLLARWRYQSIADATLPDIATWQSKLEQALQSNEKSAIVAAFSHYFAALITKNQLATGTQWVRTRQEAGERSAAFTLIADVLETAHTNQRRLDQGLNDIASLQQRVPDNLLLTLAESRLRYFTLTQGYRPADEVLVNFARKQPNDTALQRTIGLHRDQLAKWARSPSRAKRASNTSLYPSIIERLQTRTRASL